MAEQYSGIHPQVSIQHLNIVFKAYGRNISAKEIFFKKIFLSFEIIIQYIILPRFSLHCFPPTPLLSHKFMVSISLIVVAFLGVWPLFP